MAQASWDFLWIFFPVVETNGSLLVIVIARVPTSQSRCFPFLIEEPTRKEYGKSMAFNGPYWPELLLVCKGIAMALNQLWSVERLPNALS